MRLAHLRNSFWGGVFSGIAVTILLGIIGYSFFIHAFRNKEKILYEVPSPGSTYHAIVTRNWGGGAAGWCYKQLYVVGDRERFNLNNDQSRSQYAAFHIECGSNLAVQWLGNSHLEVTYSLSGQNFGASIYQRPKSADGEVELSYIVISSPPERRAP